MTKATDSEISLLHAAAEVGDLGSCQIIISDGISPNIRDQEGQTPLQIAIEVGNMNIVQFLLQSGADPEATDHHGDSVYSIALEERDNDLIRLLTPYLRTRMFDR